MSRRHSNTGSALPPPQQEDGLVTRIELVGGTPRAYGSAINGYVSADHYRAYNDRFIVNSNYDSSPFVYTGGAMKKVCPTNLVGLRSSPVTPVDNNPKYASIQAIGIPLRLVYQGYFNPRLNSSFTNYSSSTNHLMSNIADNNSNYRGYALIMNATNSGFRIEMHDCTSTNKPKASTLVGSSSTYSNTNLPNANNLLTVYVDIDLDNHCKFRAFDENGNIDFSSSIITLYPSVSSYTSAITQSCFSAGGWSDQVPNYVKKVEAWDGRCLSDFMQ